MILANRLRLPFFHPSGGSANLFEEGTNSLRSIRLYVKIAMDSSTPEKVSMLQSIRSIFLGKNLSGRYIGYVRYKRESV